MFNLKSRSFAKITAVTVVAAAGLTSLNMRSADAITPDAQSKLNLGHRV